MSRQERLMLLLAALLVAGVVSGLLAGCADLPPGPEEVQHEQQMSNYAEGAWLVLDTVDTLQTVQIAKHHCYYEEDPAAVALYGGDHPQVGRVIGVNVAMAFAHTLVASWLDDRVAEHAMTGDTFGAWRAVRVAFHLLSLSYSGVSVVHNYNIGLTPTSARSCQ